jgi:putative FmdB family regulatory protein
VPLYEYECRRCHHRFEVIQSVADKPIRKCPMCRKGTVQKLVSSPALRFKGSGWYVTDYAGKKAAGPGEGAAGESGAESAGKEGEAGKVRPEKKAAGDSGKAESARKAKKTD